LTEHFGKSTAVGKHPFAGTEYPIACQQIS
jgi:hypothetical protein